MTNFVQGFLFDDFAIRGAMVSLDSVWTQVHQHQSLAAPVKRLLGETLAATTLLAHHSKFDGDVVVHIENLDKHDSRTSPLDLVVAKCGLMQGVDGVTGLIETQLGVSATARLLDGADAATITDQSVLLSQNMRCVVSFEPRSQHLQRYQSIIDVSAAATIGAALQTYMTDSAQIPTQFYLSVNTNSPEPQVRGILLQQVAGEGGQTIASSDEDWRRINLLAHTLRPNEMHESSMIDLLSKLFWQEKVRVFEPQAVQFHCSCSLGKVKNMLISLGEKELYETLEAEKIIAVRCEFCGQNYRFDSVADVMAA